MFNGSRLAKGIFYDLNAALPVHHCEIKADVRELALGLSCQEFGRRGDEPVHLFATKSCGSAGETRAFLDFDEDNLWTVAENQIDFPALPAPPGCGKVMRPRRVVTRDDIFCGKTRVI